MREYNKSEKYNGHKNWAYWNVALWLNNDQGLYNLARDLKSLGDTRTEAAATLMQHFKEVGITETPDGAVYTKHNVMIGLHGIWEA